MTIAHTLVVPFVVVVVVVAKVVKFGERTESMLQKTVHRNWCTIAFVQTVNRLAGRHQVLQHMSTLIMAFDDSVHNNVLDSHEPKINAHMQTYLPFNYHRMNCIG